MNRVKSKYHALHVLKTSELRLRKAIINNCKKELVNFIGECVLTFLNANMILTDCNARKLKKQKSALR